MSAPIGRLRAAWRVLWGSARTERQLHATELEVRREWLEYKLTFDDILTKFSAQLAREAKARKKELERSLQEEEAMGTPRAPTRHARHEYKAELARRAREKGIGVVNGAGPLIHHQPSEQP